MIASARHAPLEGDAARDAPSLVDRFVRRVTYLRLSVTDRCDLRCVYCMAENMTFLPKGQLLELEELHQIASAFIALGIRKIRLTGGEPLVRKGMLNLIAALGERLGNGLDELTLTTNGTRLAAYADELAAAGIKRINVSLDTRDPALFRRLTRGGQLDQVLAGIAAAGRAGLAVKINTVALAGVNENEIPDLIYWAHGQGMDLTLIETMPLGDIDEDRTAQYLSLASVRKRLERGWTLTDLPMSTGGPARYVHVKETGGRLGLITPLTHNFCAGCNRVRVTCTGILYTCLGRDDAADLRAVMRNGGSSDELRRTIIAAVQAKPHGHDFAIAPDSRPTVKRHMSTTGG
jgi:GTP 3',8-cyclase